MVVAFCAGEVLIGFELLHSKFRADLPAIQMWPVSEEAWQLWNPTDPGQRGLMMFNRFSSA